MMTSVSCGQALDKHKPYLIVVIIQFIYAGMSIMSKAAISEGMNAFVFVFYRQLFAAFALAPFAYFLESNKTAALSCYLLLKIFFVALVGITMSLNLFCLALNYVSATFATAFSNTIPAMTFIIAALLRIEKVSIKDRHGIAKVLGAAASLAGAMMCTFVKGPPVHRSTGRQISGQPAKEYSKEDWIKGSVILIAANITWPLWLIMQAPIVKQYPAKLRLTTLQCFFSCIQSAVLAAVVERHASSWRLGWNVNLLSVVYCGLVVTGITYWLQVWAVEKKGPVFTAMFSPLALIITATFSTLLFKETLYWGSVCGIVLLVIGLYGVLWAKNKEVKTEENEQKAEPKEEVDLESITHQ